MSELFFKDANIYQNGSFFRGNLLCRNGVIAEIGPGVQNIDHVPERDCGGKMLVPGFIDLHTHGGAGVDVNAADQAGIEKIATFFASQGTTGWLASVLTDNEEQTLWCIDQLTGYMNKTPTGAALLGIHLEGPFLAPQYKGAMPEHLLQKGNTPLAMRYLDAAHGAVRYITVSPELAGVAQMIGEISDRVTVAIGHSGATYEEAMDCIRSGASASTHTFNAMRLLHQHEPAIMGAVIESDDVYCEAICDGRHLHPGTVRFLLKCKGLDRVVAVTDSIMAAGLPDGNYKLGVNDVVVSDGDAKLANGGARAGSTLTTGQALRNLVRFTGRPVTELLPLLTINPARLIKMDKTKGTIERGKDADLVLLDGELRVTATFVGGRQVYDEACC
ncbi:MAG: N-acetylglucosamine-6-phosphate deacetylase [Angelakisella sp.]